MPHLLWAADASGEPEWVNARAADYGDGQRASGRWQWTTLLHPDDREPTLDTWQRALRSVEPFDAEARLQMAEGGYRWHLIRAAPGPDGSARTHGWCCSATDNHDQHRQHARFAALADRMSQLAWMADEQGQVYWYNRRWIEYTGKQAGEMLGLGWKSVYHPEHIDALVALVSRSIETDLPFEGTFPLRGRGGCYRWFLFRAMPVRDDEDRVHWLGTATDVDRQVEAEQALRDADRRKDEFLSALAHELRNPLAPIRNSLQIVGMPSAPQAARTRGLQIIERQVAHLIRLVDDLLDVARIVRGRMQLHPASADLGELLQQAVDDFESGRADRLPRIVLQRPRAAMTACCDRTRVVQVIHNLLGNAVKFTPAGGHVCVALQRRGELAEITIADTGAGIPAELLEQLFAPFSQGKQELARQSGGLGLGLSLVKGIVELHGGEVAVDSAGTGRGTRVTVRLPCERATTDEPGGDVSHPAAEPALRILIIEDNRDSAESLRALLELHGHDVQDVADGAAGIDSLRRDPRDAVVCDIGLAGSMDGYAVARAIRGDPALSGLLLIALSGYGQAADVQRALDAGFDVHMTKPAQIARLQQLLAGARSR